MYMIHVSIKPICSVLLISLSASIDYDVI